MKKIPFLSNKFVSLDWDQHLLRVVEAAPQVNGVRITRAFAAKIPSGLDFSDTASLGQFFGKVLRTQKVGTRHAVLDVPRDRVVLNTLTLPPTPLQDLPNMVRFQIAKELPFAVEEGYIDFAINTTDNNGNVTEVLVAAMRDEQLEHIKMLARHAGLKLLRVGLRPYANLVAATYQREDQAVSDSEQVLFVDIGAESTEIDILQGAVLAFSRSASVTISDNARTGDSERKEALDDLELEISRSIQAYRASDPGSQIARVVVAGTSGLERELSERIGARFSAEYEVYAPPVHVDADTPDELSGFSAVLGLALGHARPGTLSFDFIHPKHEIRVASPKRRQAITAAAIVAVVIAGAIGVLVQQNSRRQTALAELKQKIDDLDDKLDSKDAKLFKERAKAVSEWTQDRLHVLEELRVLTEYFPSTETAYLTEMQLLETGQIAMEGRGNVVDVDRVMFDNLTRDNAYEFETRSVTMHQNDRKYSYVFNANANFMNRPDDILTKDKADTGDQDAAEATDTMPAGIESADTAPADDTAIEDIADSDTNTAATDADTQAVNEQPQPPATMPTIGPAPDTAGESVTTPDDNEGDATTPKTPGNDTETTTGEA